MLLSCANSGVASNATVLKTQITLANLVKIFGAEEHAREIMGDVNLSGEGVIRYEEFKSMMMEMPLDGRDPLTPRTPRTPFTVRT